MGSTMKVVLVIPVYDDWPSLNYLLTALDQQSGLDFVEFHIFVINDGSHTAPPLDFWQENRFSHIRTIRLINLICNLGHQRAIAVGLVTAITEPGIDGVIVMDADGEDRPADIPRLLAMAMKSPAHIVCARRAKRSESFAFKSFYIAYKAMFRILAGASIDFGNFCYIPHTALHGLSYSPSLWNHLAATLVRSRLPLIRVAAERGHRYVGRSRMNLDTLVAHGLSAISVYSDIVLVRIMIGMLGVSVMTVIGIIIVTAIRLFTELAIPGWASSVFGSLSMVFLQSLILAVISAFLLLSARSSKPVIPMIDAPQFIASSEQHDVVSLARTTAS